MTRNPARIPCLALAACLAAACAAPATGAARRSDVPLAAGICDDDVTRAIEKGREYLLSLRNADGSFTQDPAWRNCYTSLILMTGQLGAAAGYDLTAGVQFRRALRIGRAKKDYAELWGVWAGERIVGVYSPLDLMFSLSPYEAHNLGGYKAEDAAAVVTNIVLYLTARGAPAGAEPAPDAPAEADESAPARQPGLSIPRKSEGGAAVPW